MSRERENIRRRGFSYERALVKKLWKHGFAAIRGPASGAKAREIVQPDVVAMKNGVILVFEVKSVKKSYAKLYINKSQVERLKEFASRASSYAFIAIKIRETKDWIFIPLDKLECTDKGNYKVDLTTTPYLNFNSIVRLADKETIRLDAFLKKRSG